MRKIILLSAFMLVACAGYETKFRDVDANRDGTLTRNEIAAYHDHLLLKQDLNGDGVITKDEFDRYANNKRSPWRSKRYD